MELYLRKCKSCQIATELRPSILNDLGITAPMEWQSEEFQKKAAIKITFKSNLPNVLINPRSSYRPVQNLPRKAYQCIAPPRSNKSKLILNH